ncbi:MAG TPA: redoxin domain-containing protein [Desulfatiglandales bacterium]
MQPPTKRGLTCGAMGALAVVMTIFGLSCGNQGDDKLKAQENTTEQPRQQASSAAQTQSGPSAVSQRMSQAFSDGKYVYLFFYEAGNPGCETMEKNLDSFARRTKKNVDIIKVDRKDPENTDLVTKLRTQTAPIPLTLLFDPSGAVVAAYTTVISEEEMDGAFPSPKKAETLQCVRQGKGAILCFSNKEMTSRAEVRTCCSQAQDALAGKAEYINVDLSDPREAGFIKELRIDPNTAEPVTFVINPQGQVTGKYGAGVQVADLVEAATRVVKSGCCPTGSGKTCPPAQPKKK